MHNNTDAQIKTCDAPANSSQKDTLHTTTSHGA